LGHIKEKGKGEGISIIIKESRWTPSLRRTTFEGRHIHQEEIFYQYHRKNQEGSTLNILSSRSIFSSKYLYVHIWIYQNVLFQGKKQVGCGIKLSCMEEEDIFDPHRKWSHETCWVTKPPKEEAQSLTNYMKMEVKAQRILVKSIKGPLIRYVSKLETSKEIYDKLVELL